MNSLAKKKIGECFAENSFIFDSIQRAVFQNVLESQERAKQKTRFNQGILQIGIEVEFFLFSITGNVATLEQSQEFLRCLSTIPGWRIYSKIGEGRDLILNVSCDQPNDAYHSVKYEHPPHMLELALAPAASLFELKDELEKSLAALLKAAELAYLEINFSPSIHPPKLNWDEIKKVDPRYISLSNSREIFVDNDQLNEPWVNFTTYTAATQYHIGGLNWWEQHPKFMDSLYRAELYSGNNAYEILSSDRKLQKDTFKQRWHGYKSVFHSLELLGFPKFDEWTIQTWIKAFARSSLVVENSHSASGKSLFSLLQRDPKQDVLSLVSKVRDLQIIKPKLIGTLEFRADPALPNPESILKQAAFRLGTYLVCLKPRVSILKDLSLSHISERWWDEINIEGFEQGKEEFKDHIWQCFRERGLNEEGLL